MASSKCTRAGVDGPQASVKFRRKTDVAEVDYKVGTRALIHLVTITISVADVKSPLVLSLLYSSGFQPPGNCEETTVHENNHRS